MRGYYSMNCFPSLEDIVLMSDSREEAEMQLIASHNLLRSIKSMENNFDFEDNLMLEAESHVSFDVLPKEEVVRGWKAVGMTQEDVESGGKKKKSGCVCKKTGCLKLYCECFANGRLCGDECSCVNCGNVEQNKDEIANAKCFRKNKSQGGEKRCNCRKSNCQKKYCECFNAGRACTQHCNCVGCHNPKNFIKAAHQKHHVQ